MTIPIAFPDVVEEAHARAQEFQRLPPDERLRQIASLMELGLALVRSSPRREWIEKRMADEEAEWQRIQRELFTNHAG